jgi:hypothetical protein
MKRRQLKPSQMRAVLVLYARLYRGDMLHVDCELSVEHAVTRSRLAVSQGRT